MFGNLKFYIIVVFIIFSNECFADIKKNQKDTVNKTTEILKDAKVEAARKEIEITVRSVDISKFPTIKLMIEAYNKLGEPLDTLISSQVSVFESKTPKKVISVEKIPAATDVPVDFVFLVDITGSMQPIINSIRSNITNFTQSLLKRGINYRLGLILFGDDVEKSYNPTPEVTNFLNWIGTVKAKGGGDVKENALEALETSATLIKWRDEANKVCVVITDAPFHELGEDGEGITDQTHESIIELMQKNQIRVFTIAPPKLDLYKYISSKTRGANYDIDYSFSTILDNFSNQLTNLYNITYKSEEATVPDSIDIALFSIENKKLIKKTIPIIELGRKLIIENLLFPLASSVLSENVKELDILSNFMNSKQNIVIVIEGHTDNIGSDLLNDKLSLDRAETVKTYLVKHGISSLRIQTKGFGKKRPLTKNDSEFGRKLNRRTEIIIVAK
jgi:outer membrane protein OmpA-like peptidoglycan-associated protein